jgi:AAA ATPase domain
MTERAGTVGNRLWQARRRRFVGRTAEIELFAGALAAPGESFTILFLHGPGGAGKSALLGELDEAARAAGWVTTWLDARTVPPNPAGFRSALAASLGAADADAAMAELRSGGRRVLLLDTYELLEPLDDWVREQLLPDLPADALVVIAGRHPPSRWLADPGWRELLRVVSLRNLRPDDSFAYLRTEGVPEQLHDRLVRMSHGHPLTLSILVEAVGRDSPLPAALAEAPDLVRALLGRVVDEVPSARHRRALEVCAHLRFTTEELLRAALGPDCHDMFAWLRTLSFVAEARQGICPHDVARDVLDADLRWRDPVGYADLHRLLRRQLVERVRKAPGDPQRVADVAFLSRTDPVISGYFDLGGMRGAYIDEMRPDDTDAVLTMTRERQGEEQVRYARFWLERQQDAFVIFRDVAGTPVGYGAYLALHRAAENDLMADPGTRALWEYAQRNGPPRAGEQVYAWRLAVDTELGGPRPTRMETLIRLYHGEQILTRHDCAWDFVCVEPDRDYYRPMYDHYDFHLAPQSCFDIGGRPYDVYSHDWRRLGPEQWLELTTERELGAPVTPPTGASTELVLSEPEFADAVRAALQDLHQFDRLAANPLTRSRLVRDRVGEQSAATLHDLVVRAADTLRRDPRDESLHRVLDRTFLRPAPTQERAAEMLGLPFSTYRRHRNRAVDRIVSALWEWELHGPGQEPFRARV